MTALRACRRPVQVAARSLLLVLLLACAVVQAQQVAAIPTLDSPVVDTTGTLDAETTKALEAQALALQQRKGSQLQVLMVPTTQPEDIAAYTQRVYDQWRLGREDVGDGLLLVVAKHDRRVRIHTGYGLEGAIPDATAERVIQEYLVPKFRTDDFAGGITDAVGALVRLVDGEPLPAPMADNRGRNGRGGGDWVFALFAAFIVAQAARGMFRGVPKLLRGMLGAVAAGGVAWLLAHALLVGGIGALIGLVLGIATTQPGRYARHGGWGGFGGGGWGGGGMGGGSMGGGSMGGGGWSGGGGMSGGGGASGSW